MMTPKRAVALSLANIIADGLDDVLSEPFEILLLRHSPKVQDSLKKEAEKKITTYLHCAASPKSFKDAFDQLSLLPLAHVFVPKKEAFDYRKIAIIEPENLLLYQAIAIMIAEPFEKARRKIARQRISSYRFKPTAAKGRLFNSDHNLRTFQSQSALMSKHKSNNYIVKSDISNFYDRINIHRLESTLLTIDGLDKRLVELINQILLHWARRDSYGIPTGSNASRVLAEVALFNVDRALVEANVKFVRFVDDYRMFAKTATEAHSSLAMLIDLLNREGLFINTRKSSIERLEKAKNESILKSERKVEAEKIPLKEFRIFAGYGGIIPIKYRVPTRKSEEKYIKVNLRELIKEIRDDDFARPEQLKDLLYGIVIQERYDEVSTASDLVEMFPQFYPLFVDMLIKNAEHLPQKIKDEVSARLSRRLLGDDFLPEYLRASLIQLLGSKEFFDRDSVMSFIRRLRRSAGTYLGRTSFDAAQNLRDRLDALEIRDYFDRSNDWERRRIIRLMKELLPEQEYNAWRRAIRTYIAKDFLALAI